MRKLTDGTNASAHHLALGNLHGQSQIGDAHMAVVVEQNVLGFAVAVHDALLVQMLETAHDFGRIESGTGHLEAGLAAHVVDVELEIAAW